MCPWQIVQNCRFAPYMTFLAIKSLLQVAMPSKNRRSKVQGVIRARRNAVSGHRVILELLMGPPIVETDETAYCPETRSHGALPGPLDVDISDADVDYSDSSDDDAFDESTGPTIDIAAYWKLQARVTLVDTIAAKKKAEEMKNTPGAVKGLSGHLHLPTSDGKRLLPSKTEKQTLQNKLTNPRVLTH